MATDCASAHRFNLLNGGSYFALGAGGAITGRGANLLLIDDPTKLSADSNSDAYLAVTSRMERVDRLYPIAGRQPGDCDHPDAIPYKRSARLAVARARR